MKAMTMKPKRFEPTAITFRSERGVWSTISVYTKALAPVTGPLLVAISDIASALGRADRQHRNLEAQLNLLADEE
jgi:hypothetical protein